MNPGFPPAREEAPSSGLRVSIMMSTFLASAIHLLLLFRGFYSATLDESGRTLDAYNWVHGNETLATVWLPFYKIIVGGCLLIAPDLFVTPRVISFVFGVAALCAIIWCAQVLFNNRATTVLTGLIAAVFPARAVLTVAPLAEIMFIAVLTSAVGFLSRWLFVGKQRDLWLSAVLLAVGSSIRYEGWIVAGVFALLVVVLSVSRSTMQKVSPQTGVGAILVSFSFVVFWILLHLLEKGRAFGFVTGTTGRYTLIHGDSLYSLLWNNPLAQFVFQNAGTLNIIGVLSVVRCLRRDLSARAAASFPFVALVLVSLVALLGKGMPTHGFWRIPTVWSVLLIPYTADWFGSRVDLSRELKGFKTFAMVAVLVCLLALCLFGTFSMTEHSAFSRDDLAAGRYIHSQLVQSPGPHNVLIESEIWSYVNVMVASQHPEWFILNSGVDPTEHRTPLLDPDKAFDPAALRQMGVTLLVFRREDFKDYLGTKAQVKGLEEFGPWTVYAFPSSPGP